MGLFFLGIMAIGGATGGAMNNSGAVIEDACKSYQDALKQYCEAKKTWLDNISAAKALSSTIQEQNKLLLSKITNYKVALSSIKDAFKLKYIAVLIGVSLLVLVLIGALLLKLSGFTHWFMKTITFGLIK